jgi:DNA polymerase III gamma/tau subunit
MSTELYKKHRPTLLKDVLGQTEATQVLLKMVKTNSIPHALLFTGPSGCGKTTLARILKEKLECSDTDFCEINAANFRGIDTVREIQQRITLSPMNGKSRVWLIDEAHQMVSQAQNALLKMLEDTPSHAYFFLATTDPHKLLPTIITRCTEVRVKALSPSAMSDLIKSVLEKEKKKLEEEVYERIIEFANGSARKCLVLLNAVIDLETAEQQMESIQASDLKPKAIQLARALVAPNASWREVSLLLKDLKDEEPEQLRHMILGYASSVLLGGGRLEKKACLMIQAFERNFYDSKRAGLICACYEVVTMKL